ncbi:hypothetical protein BJ980_000477 [Nocardioides daedukensis]|uniref:Acyl-CoA dehydrogenase n=1 Tax=Nocardioides daedukensis TaxID=634462 RepID=A0A7Y9UT88_9ACTN|nr:hypothetical protein [Nocardioides daedukensis]
MKFTFTAEQESFATTLDKMLTSADTVAIARAWGDDDTAPGLALWKRLADQGVQALIVDEESGGMGASPVELAIAFEALGRHAVPGPWVESVAYLPMALGNGDVVEALAAGAVGTVAAAGSSQRALDADIADHTFVAKDGSLMSGAPGERAHSVDPTRRLFALTEGEDVAHGDLDAAFDMAVLATSAQLLGVGERLLADAVAYVKQRRQFGREIGSYQAIKHQLADCRIALDFARPLIHGAALTVAGPEGARDVSAAKVAAAEAAYRTSRVALQVHGAIGYTQEFDLSIWILKVRALLTAWGTPAAHRARILSALTVGA